MKILHYALGFPPFRRGGMTKYCMDLMLEQAKMGHEVSMLWPGTYWTKSARLSFRKRTPFITDGVHIGSLEMVNPLPVPLLNGITDIPAYTQIKDFGTVKTFLMEFAPDAVHVHTLMGLPAELVDVCRELEIPCVFTTHDYFGICPRWMLFRAGDVCFDDHSCRFCKECCKNSLSIWKIRILQSSLYSRMKETSIVKRLRSRNNNVINAELDEVGAEGTIEDGNRYAALRNYYVRIIESFSTIHFNSSGTRKVYKKYLSHNVDGQVISITNSEIKDRRVKRRPHRAIRFGYCGPADVHKGFDILIEACDELRREGTQGFELHIYNELDIERDYLIQHGPYNYSELPQVMNQIDVLVVPSLWYETFGFSVLEALSYGVPVVVTDRVGARDLIINGECGIVIEPTAKSLICELRELIKNPKQIEKMNISISEYVSVKTIQTHAMEIFRLYRL